MSLPFGVARRVGYTVTELLVVILILAILVGTTLPVAKKVLDDGRVREASQLVNSAFAVARTRAAGAGRPVGVYFECEQPIGAPASVRMCTKLYVAEVPPVYTGSTTFARGRVRDSSGMGSGPWIFEALDTTGMVDTAEMTVIRSLVSSNETLLIRFDFKGDWYPFLYDGTDIRLTGYGVGGVRPPGMGNSNTPAKRFQVLRMPRRVGSPIELTGGTCIDMEYSGMGLSGVEFAGVTTALAVMFMPSGAVDAIYADGITPAQPTGTLHFLVGQVQKVNDPDGANPDHASGLNKADPNTSNLADGNSLWVSVGRVNGSVTTSDNYPDVDHATHASDPWGADFPEYIEECRNLATNREQKAGR